MFHCHHIAGAESRRPKVKIEDRLGYLMALTVELAGKPGKFEEVLAMIRTLNAGRSVTIHPLICCTDPR
jgi:hypothetical protein